MQVPHTRRCCGSCCMWSGDRTLRNPAADPRKYTILIEASSTAARCNYTQGSTLFGPGNGCGNYRPMIG